MLLVYFLVWRLMVSVFFLFLLAATCDCDTPWTFRFTFLIVVFYVDELMLLGDSAHIEILFVV